MYHPLVTANMKNDLIRGRRAEPEGNKGTVEGGGFPSQLKYGLDLKVRSGIIILETNFDFNYLECSIQWPLMP